MGANLSGRRAERVAIERRGRSSEGRPPKQLPKEVEEDLLAEVQRLRALRRKNFRAAAHIRARFRRQ